MHARQQAVEEGLCLRHPGELIRDGYDETPITDPNNVRCRDRGRRSIAMVGARSGEPRDIETVSLPQDAVCLRIDCDSTNRTDKARYDGSLAGQTWTRIGETLQWACTVPHVTGIASAPAASPRRPRRIRRCRLLSRER